MTMMTTTKKIDWVKMWLNGETTPYDVLIKTCYSYFQVSHPGFIRENNIDRLLSNKKKHYLFYLNDFINRFGDRIKVAERSYIDVVYYEKNENYKNGRRRISKRIHATLDVKRKSVKGLFENFERKLEEYDIFICIYIKSPYMLFRRAILVEKEIMKNIIRIE